MELSMPRSSNFWLSMVVCGLVSAGCVIGCATGTDGGSGDPSSTTDGTDPAANGDGGGSSATPTGSGGSSNNASSTNDAGNDKSDSGSNTQTDSGNGGGGGTCPGYADPNTSASCVDTQYCGGSKPPCNPNGCDGAYWCDLSTKKCVKKPSSC